MARARTATRPEDDRQTLDVAAHLLATEPPFSRNKHYDAFRDPSFKRALALYRRIKALAADVEHAFEQQWTVRFRDGTYAGAPARQLVIEGPSTRRTAWLTPGAFTLLVKKCPRVASF
jgi:hypothetical protein